MWEGDRLFMRRRRGVKGVATVEYCKKLFPLAIDTKDFNDEQGTFSGYLSTFGNVDRAVEVVEAGAFKKTLNDSLASKQSRDNPYILPMLWQHNMLEPIGGFIDAWEDEKGLFVRGQLDLDTELGRRSYSGLKKGYLGGLSIGYRVIRDTVDRKTGIRYLKELSLIEGSVVTFPANEMATVATSDVKAGRVLSSANYTTIAKALADVRTAVDNLQSMLDSVQPQAEEKDDGSTEEGAGPLDDSTLDKEEETEASKDETEGKQFAELIEDMKFAIFLQGLKRTHI